MRHVPETFVEVYKGYLQLSGGSSGMFLDLSPKDLKAKTGKYIV